MGGCCGKKKDPSEHKPWPGASGAKGGGGVPNSTNTATNTPPHSPPRAGPDEPHTAPTPPLNSTKTMPTTSKTQPVHEPDSLGDGDSDTLADAASGMHEY